MQPELFSKWLSALRDGKYEQGERKLRIQEQFCCLGVLCDLYNPNRWQQGGCGTFYYGRAYNMLTSALHQELAIADKLTNKLANMNDGTCGESRKTFNQIADFLESIGPTKAATFGETPD